MNAAVGLMDGLGLDGDRCIRMIPRQIFHYFDHTVGKFAMTSTFLDRFDRLRWKSLIESNKVTATATVSCQWGRKVQDFPGAGRLKWLSSAKNSKMDCDCDCEASKCLTVTVP